MPCCGMSLSINMNYELKNFLIKNTVLEGSGFTAFLFSLFLLSCVNCRIKDNNSLAFIYLFVMSYVFMMVIMTSNGYVFMAILVGKLIGKLVFKTADNYKCH